MKWTMFSTLCALSLCIESFGISSYTVSSTSDDGSSGTLRYALNQINAQGTTALSSVVIATSGVCQLTSQLPAVLYPVTISATNSHVITLMPAAGQTLRGLFLYPGPSVNSLTVSVSGLNFESLSALGGSGGTTLSSLSGCGGGGGAGMGGAVFVGPNTAATFECVIGSCSAIGGVGGASAPGINSAGAGGGGLGGSGGYVQASQRGASGGGGLFFSGGNGIGSSWAAGGGGMLSSGGDGSNGIAQAGFGGSSTPFGPAGNGGNSTLFLAGPGQTFGGGGGDAGVSQGGSGGFGAGGGGGGFNLSVGFAGGPGGFGGGGGGGGFGPTLVPVFGGAGGYGGGGGGGYGGIYGGLAGFGAANGGSNGQGGGGAALGGGIFIHGLANCTLNLSDLTGGFIYNTASVTDTNAEALGQDIFMMRGATLIINNPLSGVNFTNPIESDYAADNSTTGGLQYYGPGSLTLNGTNSFSGAVFVLSGTLSMGPQASFSNLCPLVVGGGGCFDISNVNSSFKISDMISTNLTDGLINIGSKNLIVSIYNNSSNFRGSFASSPGGVIEFVNYNNAGTYPFNYFGTSTNFLGTITVNSGIEFFLNQYASVNPASTFNLQGGLLNVSLASSPAVVSQVIGTGTLAVGSNTLNLQPIVPSTFAGAISGSGSINIFGTLQTLSGSSSFSGIINVGPDQSLTLNSANLASQVAVAAQGLVYTQGSVSVGNISGAGVWNLGDSDLTIGGVSGGTFSGAFVGSSNSSLIVNGSSSIIIASDNSTYAGAIDISAGLLKLVGLGRLPGVIVLGTAGALDLTGVGPLANGNTVTFQSLSGAGNVNFGTQNLLLAPTAPTAPFSGKMSGSGNVSFQGAFPFYLSGQLSTQGQLYIANAGLAISGQGMLGSVSSIIFSGGTLDVTGMSGSPSGSLSSVVLSNITGTGTILGGSNTLIFSSTTPGTFQGTLSSSGNLVFNTPGALYLNTLGALNASVSVQQGSVFLLNATVFSALNALQVQGSAFLSTEAVSSTSLISNFSGSGTLGIGANNLIITNTGPQTLSGAILGTGLCVFKGSPTSSATVTITDLFASSTPLRFEVPVVLQSAQSASFANDLFIDPVLVLTGSGYVLINQNATVSSVNLTGGNLVVNGTLNCGDVDLPSGSSLQGLGTVLLTNPLEVYGTIQPGFLISSPLNIIDYSGVLFKPGSQLVSSIDQLFVSTLDITGPLTIEQGSSLFINSLAPLTSTFASYDLIKVSSGTLTGAFSNLGSNLSLSQLNLFYYPDLLRLTITAQLQGQGNAAKVANVFNQYMLTNSMQLQTILTNLLDAQSQGNGQSALDQLHPGIFKSSSNIREALMDNVMLAMIKECELDHITILCPCKEKKQQPKVHEDDWFFYEEKQAPQVCTYKPHKAHVYLKALGSAYIQGSSGQYVGFKDASYGALLGFGYQLSDRFSLRLGGAYQTGRLDNYKHRGHTTMWQASVMALGNYNSHRVEAAFGYSYGWNQQTSNRTINFVNIFEKAKNTHGAHLQAGFLKCGLLYKLSHSLSIGPYDYISGIWQHENAFQETGAGLLDLSVKASTSLYLRNELGVRFNSCAALSSINLKSFLKAAWVQQIHLNGKTYKGQISTLLPEISVSGWAPTRALGLLGIGLNAGYGQDRFDLGLEYDLEANHNYLGQRAALGFSIHF